MSKYWNKYYSKTHIRKPSNFAKFCVKYFKPKTTILELGCGNGRDSIFFYNKKFKVVGIDSSLVIDTLPFSIGLTFLRRDFTKLPDCLVENVYSRFSLHSVSKRDETRVLKWVYRNLLDGVFCIEVRSVNDEYYGKGKKVGKDAYIDTHYRRFIRKERLEESLKKTGFKIIYSKEARDFAPFKKENPSIIRIIAKKD